MDDVVESYWKFTDALLQCNRSFGSLHTFSTKNCDAWIYGIESIYNEVFVEKTAYKDNTEMPWGTWLTNCLFPRYLYVQNDCSLRKLLTDKRFFDPPSFSSRKSCHNHLGRISQPRSVVGSQYIGFLDYMLDRWSRDNHRSMPHFYFNTEDPVWIWEELMRNPNQIKTGRTSTTCITNCSFRWDKSNKSLVLTLILKHTQWHHSVGDFCGGALIAEAIAKELKLPPSQQIVNIFFVSASLDYPKEAKQVHHRIREEMLFW